MMFRSGLAFCFAIASAFLIHSSTDVLAQDAKRSEKPVRTLYASFDHGFDADEATGDKRCYLKQGKELVPMAGNDEVKFLPEGE
ncbi:MAG: hypothetical protein U0892_10175 [Pirellulales bacterium]